MTSITTKAGMRNYIKMMLGAPVINVELHDIQMDQIIEDSAELINRYNYGDGSYRDYLVFHATNGVDEYDLSGNDIQDIYDFDFSSGASGINTLFSPAHTLLYNDWVVKGNYPGGGSNNLHLTEYQISMSYLEDIKRYFSREYIVDWLPNKQMLKLTPTPNEDLDGILFLYKKSKVRDLYNNILFKEICVAKAKKLWGFILTKISGVQLPGGGTIDGNAILSEGKEEEEKILQKINDESEPIDFFVE